MREAWEETAFWKLRNLQFSNIHGVPGLFVKETGLKLRETRNHVCECRTVSCYQTGDNVNIECRSLIRSSYNNVSDVG